MMIQQLQQIFHSITKSLEVLYIIEDAKSCARIMVFEDELNKIADFLKNSKLNYSVSDFKVVKQKLQSEFYSDKSIKIPKNNEEKGYYLVYISKNKKISEKAKLMEENGNHFELGIVLGYPKCCCEFFVNNFNDANTDLTLKILENSDGYEFPFYTNIASRHFDVSLLSHFPHSFGCSPSIEIAKKNLKIIHKYSKQLAEIYATIMRSVVIYTAEEGIFLLRNYQKNDGEIIYSDVLSTTKNKMYFLISSNKKLKIISKNNFAVSDINILGDNYGIMVFT